MRSHMNPQTFFQDPNTLEQLELFDIVPDRPLPVPRLQDDPDGELHMEWLRSQSEDSLRILLQILENTPGFRRS
jgi:hypothetical protein